MRKDRKKGPAQAAPRLARLFPDHPLMDERLEFEFEGFARTLAELAWNPENRTPFTVVVRGGWGRGKTTLLRRAQWMLENPREVEDGVPSGVRKVRTLWFNAWKYPDDDTVLAGLLGAVIDRLEEGGKLDQLKALVASYKSATLKALFALAAPAPLRDLITGEVESQFAPVHEKRAFHDSFRKMFNEVSRLLFDVTLAFRDAGGLRESELWSPEAERREVLVVFLDDLDRCRRERVVEVLEAINLFLDLPGVCFFLGIDWDRLVDVLPETVRDDPDQFLEKIVQVAFELPEVSPEGAEGYVGRLLRGTDLARVLGGDGDAPSEDVRVLARALERRHPRHAKRFLNDLSMALAVLRNTGKLGTEEEQLPEAAVVAWHLLSEILPRDRWREVRALPQNLIKLFRELEEIEKDEGEEASERGEVPEEWGRLRRSGFSERHLELLQELSERQRHVLVYYATPPAVEVVKERRARGQRDLFDLRSSAWVEIPGGSFWMGAQRDDSKTPGYDQGAASLESPVRRVTLGPFRISRYPVTNGAYQLFVRETGTKPPEHWEDGEIPEGKEEHPVVHVSWTYAVAFCEWLSRRFAAAGEEITVRLPTEAQWEYTARGEEGRTYPWGPDKPGENRANYGSNVGDTTPVGSYPEGATPEGVHDLAGNVFEWCADWMGEYEAEDETAPTGPPSGASRVLRGGSCLVAPLFLRAAFRDASHPDVRLAFFGFRLCCSSPEGS